MDNSEKGIVASRSNEHITSVEAALDRLENLGAGLNPYENNPGTSIAKDVSIIRAGTHPIHD